MNNRKNKTTALLIITCLLLNVLVVLDSCDNADRKIKQQNVICFIDFSETPDWPDRMRSMKEVIKKSIIAKLPYNTKLVILPLDKSSANASKEILVATIADEFDFIPDGTASIDEEKVALEKIKKLKDSLIVKFDSEFDITTSERKGMQKGTDIFGALQQAQRYLNITEGNENSIILLSDMMNWNSTLKMESGNFNPSMLNSAIKEAPTSDLKGINILVYTGNTNYIDAVHYAVVKMFWEKYFKREQIKLIDYSSGALTSLENYISNTKK